MRIHPYPMAFIGKQETQMTEEEVRALLEKIELEKKFPSYTELRKRVIMTLPRLLDRPCPELIRLVPSFPERFSITPEIEEVAERLINSGTTVVTTKGERVGFPYSFKERTLPENFGKVKKFDIWNQSVPFDGGLGEFDNLRAKVLEALPVLVGWLTAHQISVEIPTEPHSAEHLDRLLHPGLSTSSSLFHNY